MSHDYLCMGCMTAKGASDVCGECGWKEGTMPASAVQLPARTVLNEQYLLGRVLGQGGFGITYLAWDMKLERKVAIKEYFPHSIASRSFGGSNLSVYNGKDGNDFNYGLEKFLQEGKALAKFQDHPGIVSVLNFFKANGTGYLVMEYVEGMTFKSYLEQEGGKLSFGIALNILIPVMDALREVHKGGLLHRDISPENIYISEKGQVKLLDFGAARYALGEHSKSLSIILKEGYAPEEQYRGKGVQGPWTDVYAIGATLYRAITGAVPPQALDRLVDDELLPPAELGVSVPGASEKALMKALAVRAPGRYQNIEEFQANLGMETVSDVDGKLDEAAFKFAKKVGSPDAFKVYLEEHPRGMYVDDVKRILQNMDGPIVDARKKKENEAFEMAKRTDTLDAYKAFLEEFPKGNFVNSAIKRMNELYVKVEDRVIKETPVPGKKGKVAGGFKIFLYWLGFSTLLTLCLNALFEDWDLRWFQGYSDDESGTIFGLMISFVIGLFIVIYRTIKRIKPGS